MQLFWNPQQVQAQDGVIRIKAGPGCPQAGTVIKTYDSSNGGIAASVKDTIPFEWWTSQDLGLNGAPIPYSTLQAASVMVRTRIMFQDKTPLNSSYEYITANLNTRTGQQNQYQSCGGYTMDTVPDGGSLYGNDPNYQSNAATTSTVDYHIVQIDGSVMQAAFYDVQQRASAKCTEQSDDWKFCAVSALGVDFSQSGYAPNINARRVNIMPVDKIRFEAEAFTERIQPRSNHYWFCYTSSGGFKNKCYMQAVPNDGTIFRSNQNYISNAPELQYRVAFPVMALAPNRKTYYVWVRGMGCSATDKSVHAGLNTNSTLSANSDDMTGWNGCSYTWSKQWIDYNSPCPCPSGDAYIQVQWDNNDGAFETFNLWMREDGMRVDRIILTTDINYNPYNDSTFADGY